MTKHTPGPWFIGRSGHGKPYQIETADGLCVTKWGGISRPASQEGEANARLIAAAPDLLDALTQCRAELLSMIDKHNKQDADDGSWLYDYQTVVEADAALAKARGEA